MRFNDGPISFILALNVIYITVKFFGYIIKQLDSHSA